MVCRRRLDISIVRYEAKVVRAIARLTKTMDTAPPLPRLYAFNLAIAALWGVTVLTWIAMYTERIAAVQAVLGLGGVFVWLAFLLGLLPEPRKESLRTVLDRFLCRARATILFVALFAIFGNYITRNAAIVAVARNDIARRIVVYPILDTGKLGAPLINEVTPANGELKLTVPAGWGKREYRIIADGLPPIDRLAQMFSRETIVLPSDFQKRPVGLIRLNAKDTRNAAQNGTGTSLEVYLWRHDRMIGKVTFPNYDGRAVWVGCDANVSIPQALKNRWPKDAAANEQWADPIAAYPLAALQEGDAISAALRSRSGGCLAAIPETMLKPTLYHDINLHEIIFSPCSGR